MRKEELLFKKSETVKNIQWYVKNVLTDEDLKTFSIPQLEKMVELMERAEKFRESCAAFYTLSATEVVQKSTGKIAYFENSGEIREETAEEYLSGRSEWDGGVRMYREIIESSEIAGHMSRFPIFLVSHKQVYNDIFQLNAPTLIGATLSEIMERVRTSVVAN